MPSRSSLHKTSPTHGPPPPKTLSKSRPDYEQRLIELIDHNSDLRQELRFLRTVYASTDALMASIYSVVQQMILNHYVRPDERGVGDVAWLDLSDELSGATQRYATSHLQAEDDWRQVQRDRDHFRRQCTASGLC